MNNINQKIVWIITQHPQELFIALPIIISAPKNIKFNLIIADHKYWRKIDTNKYQKYFINIYKFSNLSRVHNFKDFVDFIINGRKLKKQVKKLPILKNDILLSLSHVDYIENIITSRFYKNKKIYVCRDWINIFLRKTLKDLLFDRSIKIGKSDIVHYLILEPLLGLKKKTINYWLKNDLSYHDTTYSKDINKLYDKIFLLTSIYKTNLSENEIYYPHSLLIDYKKDHPQRKKIVFFMSALLQDKNFASNYYLTTSEILQNIRKKMENDYDLELRLHPNLQDAYKMIDYNGWKINKEEVSGEEYIMEHAHEIAFVVTNISTMPIFSFNIGLDGAAYYPCFKFSKIHKDIRDVIFSNLPKEYILDSTNHLPCQYNHKIIDPTSRVKNSLEKLYKYILE